MGRILAVDYGLKRTGLAVTDPLQIVASPLDTVPTAGLIDYLKHYTASNPLDAIVVGKPVQMSGEDSQTLPHIRAFVEKLKKELPAVPIEWFDERFTSRMAVQAMVAGGVPKGKRRDKGLVDRVSAAIILRGYLESRQHAAGK